VKLRGIPVAVEAACVALRLTGPAHEVQAACVALELFLAACNGVDAAIRASSPIPIETTVSAPGGQSLYAFVQQHYARTGKTPSQMREICRTILAWNRNLRRPSLIAFGDVVVRVNPNYRLAMHIDTDEGNAASITTGMQGFIEEIQSRA
jgi:hypothetical protein